MKKQWTTIADFVVYGKTNPKIDSIEVLGFDSVNDGGALTLYRTGSVGTPSQSFIDTGNNTCIDANGDVWGLVEGTIVEFNGTDNWFGNGFGDFGQGSYKLSNNYWIDPVTLAEQRNLGVGSSLYLGTGFTNGVRHVVNGDNVPAGTTHLRVLLNGKPENVLMSPVASGLVANLTETGATIGGTFVAFNWTLYKKEEIDRYDTLKSIHNPTGTYFVENRDTVNDGAGGLFKFDSSNLVSEVSSDPEQGIYVAPNFDPTGASGAFVREWDGWNIKPEWFGDINNSVLLAIDKLSVFGGVVHLGVRRYKPNDTTFDTNYVSKPNITIRGARMPEFSANCDRLEGGSVIEGRFNVFAHNFHHENVGYDMGEFVRQTYFPTYDGLSADYPLGGGTWDAFAFGTPNTGFAPRKGYSAQNIRGLLINSNSLGHVILQEAIDGGYCDNVEGMYSSLGVVIKAKNFRVGRIAGYGCSTYDVIVKSNVGAISSDIEIDSVITGKQPPNTTPHTTPAQSSIGLYLEAYDKNLSRVKIGRATLRGATQLLKLGGNPSNIIEGVNIGTLDIDGFGLITPVGVHAETVPHFSCTIGSLVISNVYDAIRYKQTSAAGGFVSDPICIQSANISNVAMRAITAIDYGKIMIEQLTVWGTINNLYQIDNNARILVGKEILRSTPASKWGTDTITLDAGWQHTGFGSQFRVILDDYKVKMKGLIKPVEGGSTDVCNLPTYLRAAELTALIAPTNDGGTLGFTSAETSPSLATLQLNSGAYTPAASTWLSLDGLSWMLD